MLSELLNKNIIQNTEPGMFSLFPVYEDRNAWESIDDKLKTHIINEAEGLIRHTWPRICDEDYEDYHKTGSRKKYDEKFKNLYDSLTKIVLAECIEGKGRFIRDIAAGINTRLNETAWINPAHLKHYGEDIIPVPDGKYLDLRCCSTAKQLAVIYYLLGKKLTESEPLLLDRMVKEIKVRVLDRYIDTDQWWTNLSEGFVINNWNTHCNKCVIVTAMIIEKDKDHLINIMQKAMKSLDVFLSSYTDDGACNEGPGYWKGASLAYIEIIHKLSELYSIKPDNIINTKIKNMGSYICKVFIHKDRFLSYADGTGKTPMFDAKLYLAGKMLNDQSMMDMAIDVFKNNRKANIYYDHFIYILSDYIEYIFSYNQLCKEATKPRGTTHYLASSVLTDSHIFTARIKQESHEGFFIGLKGGNNDESHNHNDVGCPYIYLDGEPVVIDPAAGTYTSKTFSNERYEIWTMQSIWHSLPKINGFMQNAGAMYQSESFKWKEDENYAWASLEIAKAYPKESGIKSYIREIRLNRKENMAYINDSLILDNPSENIVFHITLFSKPALVRPGEILLKNEHTSVRLLYNDSLVLFDFIEMDLTYDTKLSGSWGNNIYRADFKVKNVSDKFNLEFCFIQNNL